MHLKDVRSFGSEGRRPELGEIPAHDTVQPTVIFKVDHIKDFKIVRRPPSEKKQPENSFTQDPAIVASSAQAERPK